MGGGIVVGIVLLARGAFLARCEEFFVYGDILADPRFVHREVFALGMSTQLVFPSEALRVVLTQSAHDFVVRWAYVRSLGYRYNIFRRTVFGDHAYKWMFGRG